jgi:vancomycin permeability regulator SanA
MGCTLLRTLRPCGIALGIFVLLGALLARDGAGSSITAVWLRADLPEPFLSLLAGFLGVCLVVPTRWAGQARCRWILAGVFAAFAILAAAGTAAYYEAWWHGRLRTDLPVPFTVVPLFVLGSELWRTALGPVQTEPLTPPPARVFFKSLGVGFSFLGITLAFVVTYGHVDRRRPADAAVIFGAKVEADGTPSRALQERLDTGLELWSQGLVAHLILTGGRDQSGQSEPAVMREYAIRGGVPASRILTDEGGLNTRASAVNVRTLLDAHGLRSVLAVTQHFHCARVKMAFDREGVPCDTVPTCSQAVERRSEPPRRLARESYFVAREAVAFPFYLLYYR